MKHVLLASFLFLAGVGSVPVSGQPTDGSLVETSRPYLDDGPLSEPRHIRFGMTPAEVRVAMHGKPDAQLAPGIWVYWHFQSGILGAEKFDTLLVSFTRGQVTQYRLVERKAVRALMQALHKTPPTAGAIVKK